jgi:hypothetical protein
LERSEMMPTGCIKAILTVQIAVRFAVQRGSIRFPRWVVGKPHDLCAKFLRPER